MKLLSLFMFLEALDSPEEKSKFTKMYLEYKNLMYHIAYGVLQNDGAAEDAVQFTFLKALEHFHQVEAPISVRTKNWLAVIIKNQAINLYNRRRREREHMAEIEEMEQLPHTLRPEEMTDEYDLKELIAVLPEKYRDILNLVVVYQHDYKTIAALLSITPENARKRFQRAREMLKELLRERGEFVDDL